MYQKFGSFKKTLYICQRQKVTFGYPGRIPREGKALSILPIFTNANHAIGYAAECGEQDLIDTTPFKSHLWVAFIFHLLFWRYGWNLDCEDSKKMENTFFLPKKSALSALSAREMKQNYRAKVILKRRKMQKQLTSDIV